MSSGLNPREVIVVIPARGGSKGIPGKNLRQVYHQPLIAWTIRWALHVGLVPLVSTDSPAIAAIAMELGARVPFIRPSELATDEIRSVDVMLHAITHEMQLGRIDAKYVLMLEPTSPIRRDTLLEEAFRPILSGEATACVSVLEPGNAHPNFAMYPTDSSRVGFYIDPKSDLQSRRQECPEVLFPDGTIYASTIQALNLRRSFYHDGTYLLASSRLENLDVDTEADLYLVDLVLRDLSEDHAHRHFLEGDFSWLTNTAST